MATEHPIELVDTHAHIDYPDYDSDRDAVLERAREQGVKYVINVGATLAGSLRAVEIAARYPGVFAVVGCHPHDAAGFTDKDFVRIEGLVASPKVVAIGEIGLDYYRNLSDPDRQRGLFADFIRLANRTKLPAVIHTREAAEDTLRIAKREGLTRAIVHCFSGGADFLKSCLDMGFYVSFTCNVTYKKSGGLREMARIVPLDRLCLETDAPYLSPERSRGARNEPGNVRLLAEYIADLKGLSLSDISRATTANAKRFFSINE